MTDATDSSNPVPAIIVTGFLGAGKTTLLRHLIETGGGRYAAIVNEFGDMGFDGALIESCCPDVVELKNGCVCCRVGDDLVPALEAFLDGGRPDAILVETSGLALPKPVVEAFAFPTLRQHIAVAGVVVATDAEALSRGVFDPVLEALRAPPSLAPRRASVFHGGTDGSDDPIGEVFEDQLRAADLVVVTRLDMLPPDAGRTAVERLAASLPDDVRLTVAEHGVIAGQSLLEALGADHDGHRPSRHALEGTHDHEDFESLTVELGEVDDIVGLAERVRRAMNRFALLRVKGFVAVAGRANRFVLQATPLSTTTTADGAWPSGAARTTRLVVIGPKGLERPTITHVLKGERP